MTENKPIMIDGVDVSKCFERGETISGITCGNGSKIRLADRYRYIYKYKLCKDNPNCLFKQLARKTQECEELKREIAFGNNGTLSDKIRAEVFKELNNENDQLKTENKQAERKLERIKEFATALCYTVMSDGVVTLQKDILQIIDEVENEITTEN